MGNYIVTDDDLAEITQSVSVGTTSATITPPKLDGNLPVAFAIASATGDFSLNINGSAIDVVAANLNTSNNLSIEIGIGNVLTASAAGSRTALFRWFYIHPMNSRSYKVETLKTTQDTTEAELEIPDGALELVLMRISGDLQYRIDDRSFNGGLIILDNTLINEEFTYNMPAFRGLRLRLDAVSGTVTINGYWVIGIK